MKKFIVVFRKENDRLASVCTMAFKSQVAAKQHIEADAAYVCKKNYGALDLGWIKPKTLDYYCIELKSGEKCFWQYFQMPA